MEQTLLAYRAVNFIAAMLVFGGAAFRFYALEDGDPDLLAAFEAWLGKFLLLAASAALLSALALVPLTAGMMAGSAAALDWSTISAVLGQTGFGRVWRWHLLAAALLVILCTIRPAPLFYRMVLAALLVASLGWVGHATIGRNGTGIAHEVNQSVHLLAGGIWLGGLAPLTALVVWTRQAGGGRWFAVMRAALPQFSRMGCIAVALVAITGIANTAIPVGRVDGLTGTAYGRLLLAKIALFLLLLILAGINRLILVPRIDREGVPLAGTAALLWTIGLEQGFGLAILAIV